MIFWLIYKLTDEHVDATRNFLDGARCLNIAANSGRLPIRQNRQLPKARHGAGTRSVQRKARKMYY